MKNKEHKKLVLIIFGFYVIIMISIAFLNTRAYPNESTLGCHPKGYTISVNTSEIEAEISSIYTLEVTATGESVVIDVFVGAFDNNEFIISPSNVIADNSPYDLEPAANSIHVELNITMPSQEDRYILRILARASTLDGVDTGIAVVDVSVTVGIVIIPLTPPLALFFNHNNYYIGLVVVIFMFIGLIVFQINVKKKKESKIHGIFITAAFALTTINALLIMKETMNYTFGLVELPIINYIGQLSHIILGSVGYIAGIVAVIGIFSNVPILKMKLAVYIMFLAWTFNFFYGIFVLIPGG
ncbi:hypothetical protein LCGC14_1386770 [marine sediment metagenome]|uniref:Uncharacterized protein n=1 Tax=marine sediment metagenome TaxID=412755 RepID=A0A0F9MGM9_9ZZZZ